MTRKLSFKAYIYFSVIILIGFIISVKLFQNINYEEVNIISLLLFIAATQILVYFPIAVQSSISIWLDDILVTAVFFIFGLEWSVLVILFCDLIYELHKLIRALIVKKGKIQHKWIIINFSNPFRYVISIFLSSLVYFHINGYLELLGSFRNIIAVVVFFILRYSIERILFITGEYLYSNNSEFKNIMITNILGSFNNLLLTQPLGVILAYLYFKQPVLIIFLIIPILVMYVSVEAFLNTVRQTQDTLNALAKTIDRRDHYTFGHSERVSRISMAIAQEMNLEAYHITMLEKAGKIHDLGKIGIPDNILQKPDRLTGYEEEIMKSHSKSIMVLFENLKFLKKFFPIEIAYMHHEKYDGTGYSEGLKGEEIPVEARILAVADAYDAMTSDRAYRKKMSEEDALKNILKSAGGQFDPVIVKYLVRIYEKGKIRNIRDEWNRKELIYLKKQTSTKIDEIFSDFIK